MGSINLYKIDRVRIQEFTRDIQKKMDYTRTLERTVNRSNGDVESFGITLYYSRPEQQRDISWNWVLEEFGEKMVQISQIPKAVILVECEDKSIYAVSFGHSFFVVDKYCDRDFGFEFARRLKYKEIKTTTLTNPNSRRNKTVNTYINYSELEFDSGESFAKLKAKVDLEDGFTLYKPAIEIGSSIKFATIEESLELVAALIAHVRDTIRDCDEVYKIPVFSRIKDEMIIHRLDERLRASVKDNPGQVNISELDIIGATEIFNNNDSDFVLRYHGIRKKTASLSNEELILFCHENNLEISSAMLDIVVESYYNGDRIDAKCVRELIDYTDDIEKALLSKGIWYRFNDDYLSYLRDSVAEIETEYHPAYDFTSATHDAFVEERFAAERNSPDYFTQSDATVRSILKQKYYAERAFNLLKASQNGFQNFDRQYFSVGGSIVEAMDLYKDEMLIAVKMGNTSAKLCYAVDQSLNSLKLYKKGLLPEIPKVTTAVLWFVLERKRHIEDASGKPDLNQLQLLMLKNKLDQWKKEVRVMGFQPLVYVNYRSN